MDVDACPWDEPASRSTVAIVPVVAACVLLKKERCVFCFVAHVGTQAPLPERKLLQNAKCKQMQRPVGPIDMQVRSHLLFSLPHNLSRWANAMLVRTQACCWCRTVCSMQEGQRDVQDRQ